MSIQDMPEYQSGPDAVFEIERGAVQAGKTFSPTALSDLFTQIARFVTAQVQRAWDTRHEPPTYMKITLHVDIG